MADVSFLAAVSCSQILLHPALSGLWGARIIHRRLEPGSSDTVSLARAEPDGAEVDTSEKLL